MNRIVSKLSSRHIPEVKTSTCENCKVVPGLAYTPSDMARLSERGVSVSTVNDQLFYDGSPAASFDIPIEMRRGVDANDAWNASRSARRRILSGHRNDKKLYD